MIFPNSWWFLRCICFSWNHILNRPQNGSHFNTTLNPILNNHHELEKLNWTVPGGSKIFFKKFKTLPKRLTKVINIEYLGFYDLLKNNYPPNTGPDLLIWFDRFTAHCRLQNQLPGPILSFTTQVYNLPVYFTIASMLGNVP